MKNDRITETVLKLMPQNAEYYKTETPTEGTALSIHWKLKDDAKRPNKYSKTIVVFLSRELLDDFPNYPEPMQTAALERIEQGIRERLKTFDPTHTKSRLEHPPVERWPITTEEIFG